MSKLTVTEAVKVIPVSESTLRRDLKSGKVSFETDAKNRKQIDVSELERVYGELKTEPPVNDTHQNPSLNANDSDKIVALLEGQVQDLKAQLARADTEKAELLTLANNLQKQNEVLMLPTPKETSKWREALKAVFTRKEKHSENEADPILP